MIFLELYMPQCNQNIFISTREPQHIGESKKSRIYFSRSFYPFWISISPLLTMTPQFILL